MDGKDGTEAAAGAARWQDLRWQAFGDALLDALILWRNERERDAPLAPLIAAFGMKVDAALLQLENEATALGAAQFPKVRSR